MFRNIWIILLQLVFAVYPALILADQDAGQPRLVSVQDFDKLTSAGTPQLSPDGKQVAYTAGGAGLCRRH